MTHSGEGQVRSSLRRNHSSTTRKYDEMIIIGNASQVVFNLAVDCPFKHNYALIIIKIFAIDVLAGCVDPSI